MTKMRKFEFIVNGEGLHIISPYDDTRTPKKVLKGWESFTGWYWFSFEEVEPGFHFGLVQGIEDELGYFSEAELNKIPTIWRIKKTDLPYAGRR